MKTLHERRAAADMLRDWVERHTPAFRGMAYGNTIDVASASIARPLGLLSLNDRAMLLKIADELEHGL